MPIHKVAGGGEQWGNHGKVYHGPDAKEKAAKQAAAAHAHGYRGDAEEDADVERLQKQLEAQEKRREGLNRDSQEYADITKHMDRIHREMEKLRNFKPETKAERREDAGDVRIVYNKLLGGWYVVRGPHQTPLNGRFNSKEEAQAWLKARRSDASEAEISERIKREYNRGHPLKQAEAIAYSELGEPTQDAATAEIMDEIRAISAGCDRLDARLDAIAARSNGSR